MRSQLPVETEAIPDPTAINGNGLEKSRTTKLRILEAARDILAEHGYARFTTSAVAARAGLTRQALLYQFGSHTDLLAATVHHLLRRRIEMFEEALQGLPAAHEPYDGSFSSAAIDISWNQPDTAEFRASTELLLAARTDATLAEILNPAVAAYDKARGDASWAAMPAGFISKAQFTLSRDIVRFLIEGVAQQDSIRHMRDTRISQIRHFLHTLLATSEGREFMRSVVVGWAREHDLPTG